MKLLHGLLAILGVAIVIGIIVFIAYWNGNRVARDQATDANAPQELTGAARETRLKELAELNATTGEPKELSGEDRTRRERVLRELEGFQP